MTVTALVPVTEERVSGESGAEELPVDRQPVCAFEVGDRLYVAGMTWRSHIDPRTRLRVAAGEAARRSGARWMVLRDRAGQYGVPAGVLPPAVDARPAWSLAALLADGIHGTWIGAWPLKDGRCIVIVAGSSGILPDGDRVFAESAEARAHVDAMVATATWRHIYAPDDWSVPGAKPTPLDRLIPQARAAGNGGRLHRADRGGWLVPMLAAAAVLSVGAGALWWALAPSSRPPTLATDKAPPPPPPPAYRWATAADSFRACIDSFDALVRLRHIGGWPATSFRCAQGRAVIALKMEAPVWVLKSVVSDAVVDAMAGTALVDRPLSEVKPRTWPAGTPLGRRADVAVYLRTAAERYGGTATVAAAAPTLPGAPPANAPAAGATRPRVGWTLRTSAAPVFPQTILAPLPAASLTSAVRDAVSGEWTLQGTVHVDE